MTYPSGSADLPAFLTTKELAEMTRSPESTVRYWRHTGRGPRGTRVGKRVLYERSDVLHWLARLNRAQGGVVA